jgi:hypothetical protein
MFHSCSKHVLTAATLTCEISKVPETPCQWFGNLVQVSTHTHESLAQRTILHAPKNWWSIPILILQMQLTWQQFSVEQCEACEQISCVQSLKRTYKYVQESVVNVRIMLIIFFFIAFIDKTSIWTSKILEQFADPILSISWISNQHSIWISQSLEVISPSASWSEICIHQNWVTGSIILWTALMNLRLWTNSGTWFWMQQGDILARVGTKWFILCWVKAWYYLNCKLSIVIVSTFFH